MRQKEQIIFYVICALVKMRGEMLVQLLVFLEFLHHGSLNENWGVIYPPSTCVIKGSTVSFRCTYKYPSGNTVAEMFWCKDSDDCKTPPYVYDSNDKTIGTNEFIYIGDRTNNCTLQIRNINDTHSGEYTFRFVTHPQEKWTGSPGMSIQVTALKLSVTRLKGNGTIKDGDSFNLTCSANCTFNLSEISWFKDDVKLAGTGPVLLLTSVTYRDSGNYTCRWRGGGHMSQAFKLDVEYASNIFLAVGGVCFAVFVAIGILVIISIKRRRTEVIVTGDNSSQSGKTMGHVDSDNQNEKFEEEDNDLQYASISIKPKTNPKRCKQGDQQNNEDSVIYSSVAR
ncbi:myeloid cell surface antigen CD33 [Clupea harengus]|uniref:Myeloid cell surface antigen CD33 n=1 Tax=Clupea harengus TaxID=7950 RepID=A0A6P8G7R5_CLUHA|nr:myeloid cell surface antigen CD33 [Clupea harengus]